MASIHLQDVRKGILIARAHLLPKTGGKGAMALPTEEEFYLARHFVIAVHAEIESYLEARSLEIATEAQNQWRVNRLVTPTLFSLLAFSGLQMQKPAETLTAPKKTRIELAEKITQAISGYSGMVRVTNHGIREPNVLAMLLPLGVESSDLDSVWVKEMDDFGSLRGELAHQGLSKLLTLPSYRSSPRDALRRAMFLYAGLRKLDSKLDAILSGTGQAGRISAPSWFQVKIRKMVQAFRQSKSIL